MKTEIERKQYKLDWENGAGALLSVLGTYPNSAHTTKSRSVQEGGVTRKRREGGLTAGMKISPQKELGNLPTRAALKECRGYKSKRSLRRTIGIHTT